MIDEIELLETLSDNDKDSCFKLGIVENLFPNGTAKVRFDGEQEAREKEYSYLANYIPKKNDRILLAKVSDTYVIINSIKFMEKIEDDKNKSFEKVEAKYLTVSEITTVMNFRHVGFELGFFNNQRPARKIEVASVSTSSSSYEIARKLNELIKALKEYGLV